MNYENYEKVTAKVQQINRFKEMMAEFKGGTEVSINRTGPGRGVETVIIGTEDPLRVGLIRDIEAKIARLKDELKEL